MRIDVSKLEESCINSDTKFFANVGVAKEIDEIFVDGVAINGVVFVDVKHGFGIKIKYSLDGKVLHVGDEPIHEFFYGKIEITWRSKNGNTA